MVARRNLLKLPLLMGLPAVARAGGATPTELVLVQSGTLPIILTAPHGGQMAVPGIAPRNIEGKPKGGSSYVTDWDPETDRLAQGIAAGIETLTRQTPYLVVARFDRKYIDANRAPAIAFDNPAARPYYEHYHRSIRRFVDQVRANHAAGLLIDVHGQHKFPDSLVRGTINGRSVTRLIARAGFAAVTGPTGIFGLLERNGFRIFPANTVPPTGRNEDGGYNGGFTTNLYGSHRADGIDAVQFEFGSDYRKKSKLDDSIRAAARAVVAFHQAHLK
jgi:N-formylglutamate amidohydrolase